MTFRNVQLLMGFVFVCCTVFVIFLPQDQMWPRQSIILPSSASKLNSSQLLCFRLLAGSVIWFSCAYIYLDKDGLTLDVATRDKLIKRMVLHGMERFSPFTVWCWSLLGFYFFLVSVAGVADIMNNDILLAVTTSSTYSGICTILFEVSFSVAFLVSSIVTYVLIPGCAKQGVPVDAFYKPFSLLFHNANVVFACLESLINTITFVPSHFVFVVLWGTMYVVFSWVWFQYKGVFYYFFLDYEQPRSVLLHLGLIAVVGLFFFVGLALGSLREGGILANVVMVVLTGCVMKIRRPRTET